MAARLHANGAILDGTYTVPAGCRSEMIDTAYEHFLIFGGVCVAVWFLVIYFWPRIFLSLFKSESSLRAEPTAPSRSTRSYTEPQALFADPLHPPPGASKLWTTGVNHDTLITVGWLDLRKGPQILHVPDMAGRYYSVQFNDPSKNENFAYAGKRTTGTGAGGCDAPAWPTCDA